MPEDKDVRDHLSAICQIISEKKLDLTLFVIPKNQSEAFRIVSSGGQGAIVGDAQGAFEVRRMFDEAMCSRSVPTPSG